jgi:predicted nuclease with TOPRIM domain
VADADSKKSGTETRRSAAAQIERLAAEKEASDDKVFALTHRVATLEARERDLNELIIGHRERIAALDAEREAFARELERATREAEAVGERERALSGELSGARERAATLETERGGLTDKLDVLRGELDASRRETAALRDRERDVQGRTVILHEQVARLEAEEEMLNRALAEERTARSELEQQESGLRPQLESARERAGSLERQRAELQESAEHREQELARARERITVLESKHQELVGELDGERKTLEGERQTLAQLRDSAEEVQRELAALHDREAELESTIAGIRDQVSSLEAQRSSLITERDRLRGERDRLRSRLEQLESSRTYRMMRVTWRMKARIRHPFRRAAPRPALAKPKKAAAKPDRPAIAAAPKPAAGEGRKLKPIPTPKMRAAPAARKPEAEPEPERGAEPEKGREPGTPTQKAAEAPSRRESAPPASAPETTPPPAPVAVTEEELERERWLPKVQAPPADVRQLRVAGVLDEMSAACFGPDCDLMQIDSEGWAQQMEGHEPHLLLVESAWQGNNGSWQYMVASYTHPDYIGLPNLRALVTWCRERDVPTVFWNKEDPVHFERFKEAAALFDYVFTSDANCIERYAALEREGSGPISSLQFAAQPRVHNPIGAPVERSTSPVFAGAYYRDRHVDRQRSLQMLLDAAMPFGLEIYDRRFGHEDKAFGFPERFEERVKGALPYDQMINAYKAHRIFLNVNSVHDSPTMFSRRVFELLACGTAVVSTESVGVEQTLGEVVAMVETQEQATEAITKLQDDDYWRELTQRGHRRVLGEHTYRHRLAEVASTLGFNVTAYPGEEVAALALVDDVDQARRFGAVVSTISAQETRPAELLIGSNTSVAGDLQELQSDGSEIRVRVVQQDPDDTRSQRYRELAELAASPWLAVLHPAHTYGEHHITDLVLTTRYVDADIIGNASFETTEGSGAVDRGLEHRFVESVHPHSALVRRELIARRGWPDDAAGDALSDWFREGVRIYSGDAGNFQADAALGLPARAAGSAP